MHKPKIKDYEDYLPELMYDPMTTVEKINAIIKGMRVHHGLTSEMLSKWDEVYSWVLNEGLDNSVGDRLREWVDNGTLDRIINQEVLGELSEEIDAVVSDFHKLKEETDNRIDKKLEDIENKTDETLNEITERVGESPYYDINYGEHYDELSQSKYYITRIPYYDKEGNRIILKRGFAHDTPVGRPSESARDYSKRKDASFVSNAGTASGTNLRPNSTSVYEGRVIYEPPGGNEPGRWPLAISDEGILRHYHYTTPASEIIADGYKEVTTGFIPLVIGGQPAPDSVINTLDGGTHSKHPRQVIAQMPNRDYLYLTVDGRNEESQGMTSLDLIRILRTYGVDFGYMLDGGGSTSTVIKHKFINRRVDQNGTHERRVRDFLYFSRPTKYDHKNITDILKNMGDLSSDVDLVENNANFGAIIETVDDLDTIQKSGIYWTSGATMNKPTSNIYGVIHFQMSGNARMQIAFPYLYAGGGSKRRRTESGNSDKFRSWVDL